MVDTFKLLQELTNIYSPSGYEGQAKQLLKEVVLPFVDNSYEDTHGNLICLKDNKSRHTLMLIAHIDEVGLMVTYIDDGGFIYFRPIGGIDINILRSASVVIMHEGKKVYGIVGTIPIHMKSSQNEKELEHSDLWIDIGAKNKEDAEHLVSIGDGISVESCSHRLANNLVSCRATDDKSGIVVLAKVLENLSGELQDFNIFVVASIQEEVGTRGAITSTYSINPDICIAIDVTHATDYPLMEKARFGDVKVNGGVVIPFGTDFNANLQYKFKYLAEIHNIDFQIEARPGFSGTDIHAAQVSRGGCISGLLSIPCRYMHSQEEVVSIEDINSATKLLTELCKLKYSEIVRNT